MTSKHTPGPRGGQRRKRISTSKWGKRKLVECPECGRTMPLNPDASLPHHGPPPCPAGGKRFVAYLASEGKALVVVRAAIARARGDK